MIFGEQRALNGRKGIRSALVKREWWLSKLRWLRATPDLWPYRLLSYDRKADEAHDVRIGGVVLESSNPIWKPCDSSSAIIHTKSYLFHSTSSPFIPINSPEPPTQAIMSDITKTTETAASTAGQRRRVSFDLPQGCHHWHLPLPRSWNTLSSSITTHIHFFSKTLDLMAFFQSSGAFANLHAQKRGSMDEASQARRQSIQDQMPQAGFIGKMWNRYAPSKLLLQYVLTKCSASHAVTTTPAQLPVPKSHRFQEPELELLVELESFNWVEQHVFIDTRRPYKLFMRLEAWDLSKRHLIFDRAY